MIFLFIEVSLELSLELVNLDLCFPNSINLSVMQQQRKLITDTVLRNIHFDSFLSDV